MANMYPSKKAGGGGSGTRTTLWTNSNPTSSLGFSNITLSQSIANFSYIVFRYAVNTTYQTDEYCSEVIISKENLRKCIYNTYPSLYVELGGVTTSNYYTRHIASNSVNWSKLVVDHAFKVNGTGYDDTTMILLSVEGLNF